MKRLHNKVPKKPVRTRPIRLVVWCAADEAALIRRRATERGIAVATHLRERGLAS